MKAIVVREDQSLAWQDVAELEPGPGEVLVDVHATALNRADLSQRAGRYPPPPGSSKILGLEMAGVVRRLGEGVTGWNEGDRVCALLTGGGYAEQVVVPEAMLMPVPEGWSFEQAAGMPEVFFTAYLNLFVEGRLQPGEAVLVHGGASGVGTAAIQLAREAGCRVFITAGSDEKTAFCDALGADLAVNYRSEDFAARVMAHTGGEGVDLVLDMVGADYLQRNLEVLNLNGRLVFIATLSGRKAELDIRALMGKRLMLKGSTLRSRPLEEKLDIKHGMLSRFGEAFRAGRIGPVIDTVYPIERAEEAHEYMRRNRNIGKIILRVREGRVNIGQ